MRLSNHTSEKEQREAAAAVLKSINSVWWAIVERRYTDAEFACQVALAEIQDFVLVDRIERPFQVRLPL